MSINVDTIAEMVVLSLESAGYARSTIGQYKKSIKALKEFSICQDGIYTKELGAEFAQMTISPKTGNFSKQRKFDYNRIVWLFDCYVDSGIIDPAIIRTRAKTADPKTDSYIQLLVSWHAYMERHGLALSTKEYYGHLSREYLLFLERSGIKAICDADVWSISGFFKSLTDRSWSNTSMYSLVTSFRPFLRYLGRQDLVCACDMMRARRPHTIIPAVDKEDVAKVIAVCSNGSIPSRDAAITLLALVYGIRACDIIELRICDIDWTAGSISIIQQKTKNPLVLPLVSSVGNALSDYLIDERPQVDDDHVFLRSFAPYAALSDHSSIYDIISKTFTLAGAAKTAVGTRLLRHTAATRMVNVATPLPVVSAILGHASQDSTNTYIATDEEKMRSCVLPLPEGVQQ